ncbi:ABC transporter [Arenicella chitinivorans]|uniref:ABC transporter n=1 Tax=Arenicella chitinivorans TaxID=1329800 RepID=A0A918VQJ6_9GAMM|nr:VacJ family lipoprotein [Arenicella chitinivorans]GHA14390.1 ABC transporter [Arenicella chitinivorans]
MRLNTRSLSFLRIPVVMGTLVALTACSTLSVNDDPYKHVSADPLEGFNRKAHAFNDLADRAILRPTAKVYDTVVPEPAQQGVSHFFGNLREPVNLINNLLQGKFDGALHSTYRFVVNSTVGVFGLFDVASSYEVEARREDLGQTLAAWGVKPGPYIVIPFLGPSNLRDGTARAVGTFGYYPINELSDDTSVRLGLAALDIVDTRARFLGTDDVLNRQLDPYLFLKSAYESTRINAIYDGNPPQPSDEEEFDF